MGTTNAALSFSNKVNLLIDLGAMEKVHLQKFNLFMSIRNKFLHLHSVQSFTICLDLIEGSYNQLNKYYPPKAENEFEFEQQYIKLANDVFEIAFAIRENVKAQLIKVGESQSAKTIIELLQNSLPTTIQNLESVIAADSIDKEKLKSILNSLKSYEKTASIIEFL